MPGFLLFAWTAAAGAAGDSRIDRFHNPLDVRLPDPASIRHNGLYYLCGTGLARFVSADLVNWRRQGEYFDPAGMGFQSGVWACELAEKDGAFYLYFSVQPPGWSERCICVFRADSPDQPFVPLALPMWKDEDGWIDPHVFIDDDGARYLFATNDNKKAHGGDARIYAARLAPDMVTLETTLTLCMAPSQPWERSWQEGAWVHKRNGVYYMLWSSRLYATPNYSTGFATAPHPLGPWTKHPSNPILAKTERVSGPGHVSLAPSPDGAELFILYHTHCTSAAGGARQLAIDRLRFAPDPPGPDRMFVEGPSVDPQPYPSGAAPAQAVLGLDEFDGPALDRRRWTAIWNEGPREWRLEGGRLKIETRNGDLRGARADGRNVFLQHAPAGDWDAGTRAIFPAREDAEMAFLTVWRDCRNFLALKVGHAGGPTLIVARQTNEEYSEQRFDNEWGDSLHLRVEKRGTLYRFLASPDAVAWTPLGEPIEARFDGEKVGLGAFATDSGRHILAEFDYFSLDPPRR